ncbi:hypothetical protein, partial [Oceanobacillus oncorhynchi]|uniref:hypothetical protein n=1 Tax=Oceanobacillus oncorhynchi TaxID=545501 RepID=UPI001D0349E4
LQLLLFPQESTSLRSHLRRIMFYLLSYREKKLILATLFDGTSNCCPNPSQSQCEYPAEKSELLFYHRDISATMLLSAPAGLPISKSSLKEMSSGPMESVVFFWGCDYSPHENRWSGYLQLFYNFPIL